MAGDARDASGDAGTGKVASDGLTVPSEKVLGSLFELLAGLGKSTIGFAEMEQAIDLLNLDYRLGLEREDGARLLTFLEKTECAATSVPPQPGCVCREQFVLGVSRLAMVLQRISKSGLSLKEMKVILIAVFERFDIDKDGTISVEEFVVGVVTLGVQLSREDAVCLHSFFAADQSILPESLAREPSLEEKLDSIVKGVADMAEDRFKLSSFVSLVESVSTAVTSGRDPMVAAKSAMAAVWDGVEDICNVVEGVLELASFVVGSQYLSATLAPGGDESIDLTDYESMLDFAPFLVLVAAFGVKVNKDLGELVPRGMSEDEALLYWGLFQKQGFTQASFYRLLTCEGCSWGVAEPGEVLSNKEDRCLRIIVRGSAAVVRDCAGCPGTLLPPGAAIGETCFLGGGALWHREAVVAKSSVTYVSWDFDKLRECLSFEPEASSCMLALLSKSMVANFRLAAEVRGRRDMVPSYRQQAAQRAQSYDEVFVALDLDGDDYITREELRCCMDSVTYIFKRVGFASKAGEFDRLFAYLDTNGDGIVTRSEFRRRLEELEECTRCLRASGLTMCNLSTVLVRAHAQIDADGDGLISASEFWAAVQRLRLRLNEEQSNRLHRYLDSDGDGQVDIDEWQEHNKEVLVFTAFKETVESQVEKKGLARFAYFARRMLMVLRGPGDPIAKVQTASGIAWDGIESLGDFFSFALDAAGYMISLACIAKELSGVASPGDLDNIELAPFALFLGISSLQVVRNVAEGQISDLKESEALLYTKVFEKAGLSISDFMKLLKNGKPRWEHFEEGAALADPGAAPASPVLRAVVSGGCNVWDTELGASWVGCGSFLSNLDFSKDDVAQVPSTAAVHAAEPTSVVTWSQDMLRPYLERNTELRMKLHRAITTSMANNLLAAQSAGQNN